MRKNLDLPGDFLTERQRIVLLLFAFPIAFVLGSVGYWQYHAEEGFAGVLTAMYHAVQLFILHAPHFDEPLPWTLEAGRWLALITTVMAVVDLALHFLHNEKMEWKRARIKNHVIVCGLGTRGMDMVLKLHGMQLKVVAVEKNPVPEIAGQLARLGVPLICGDASNPEVLQKARIAFASEIYTFCPGDTTNLFIATAASQFKTKNKEPRRCTIFIEDSELRNTLQDNQTPLRKNDAQILHFIEPFGPEATSLLMDGLPLDHDGIGEKDPCSVHLVILGFGVMGRTIAVKAAQLGRFANRTTLRISVIDRYANMHKDSLLFHHPFIGDVANFLFYEQEVLSPETRNLLVNWSAEKDILMNVVFCFDNPSVVFDGVFNLLPELNKPGIRVAVRLHEDESFNFMLQGAIDRYSHLNICCFGMDTHFGEFTYPSRIETEVFAQAVHQAYLRVVEESVANDPTQREAKIRSGELTPWENLREDFRESNRQQYNHIKFKIRACGFEIVDKADPREAVQEIEEPLLTTLAIMEHDRWVAERKVNNWKYGVPSDKLNHISEYLVDWSGLPEAIRKYDYDAVQNIPRYLDKMGKKLLRRAT